MADHHSHEPMGPTEVELKESVAAGFEVQDVSLSILLRWGFGLAVFLVATAAAMLMLFAILQRPPFAAGGVSVPAWRGQPIQPPSGTPIVQDNPAGDPRPDNNPRKGVDNIREFRRDEEIRINEYAKQDNEIHIPIDRAMELTARNFPAQQPGQSPTGVSPTPEMKIHPDEGSRSPAQEQQNAPAPADRP